MKRGRYHSEPSDSIASESKKIRGASRIVPIYAETNFDINQPCPEMDGEVSPRSHPIAAPSGLRVVNTSSTPPQSEVPGNIPLAGNSKQNLVGNPIFHAGADFVFVTQNGYPVTIENQRQRHSSSECRSQQQPYGAPSDYDLLPGQTVLQHLPGPFELDFQQYLLEWETGSWTFSPSVDELRRKDSTFSFRERHPSEDYVGFDIIKPQIEHLLTTGLWIGRPLSDFTVEKLRGGSYNRIVAVSVKQPQALKRTKSQTFKRTLSKMRGKLPPGELERFSKFRTTHTSGDFILRIPRLYQSRHAKFDFEADVTMHDFVQDLGIDCPKIVTYAPKDNGVVRFPYLLQEKVPGQALCHLYHVMTPEQKIQIASQIGTICRKMIETTYSTYGQLRKLGPVPQYGGTITREVTISEPLWVWPQGASKTNPVFRILQQGLLSHKYPRPNVDWNGLCDIAEQLEDRGAFGRSGGWYFSHGDFFPRNMMAEITPEGQSRITSVLDWDTATFQPAVMACKPPSWLWQWDIYHRHGDEDNLDITAGMIPNNMCDALIKEAFDEAAGPEYCRIAYHPDAYTARKICLWTQLGDDNRIGQGWTQWVDWFIGNWKTFEDDIRRYGFPLEEDGGITSPVYI